MEDEEGDDLDMPSSMKPGGYMAKATVEELKVSNKELDKKVSVLKRKLEQSQTQSLTLLADRRYLQKKSVEYSMQTLNSVLYPRGARFVENATQSDSFSRCDPLLEEVSVPVIDSSEIPMTFKNNLRSIPL